MSLFIYVCEVQDEKDNIKTDVRTSHECWLNDALIMFNRALRHGIACHIVSDLLGLSPQTGITIHDHCNDPTANRRCERKNKKKASTLRPGRSALRPKCDECVPKRKENKTITRKSKAHQKKARWNNNARKHVRVRVHIDFNTGKQASLAPASAPVQNGENEN